MFIGLGVSISAVQVSPGDPVDDTAPTITSADPSGSYVEGDPVGGTLTADESVTWSVSGTDAGEVTLNASTGVWSLPETVFATKASYSFTFTATDGAGNSSDQVVSIAITEAVTEPPVATTRLGAAFGDSRLDRGYGLNGGSSSTVQQRFARGPQHWLAALSLGRIAFPASLDFAVGGNSIQESLDTMDADIASAESGGAGFYIWLCGVNGIRSLEDAPTTIAAEEAAIAKLKATGKPVIVIGDWPGSGATFSSTQPMWDVHRALYDHRASYASDPALIYIDGFEIMSDPSSSTPYEATSKAALYADTYLHQSPRGAYALATTDALTAIEGWFARPPDPQVGVTDQFGHTPVAITLHEDFSAAFTAGAGSGGTGNLPTGWIGTSGQASGTTRTNSKTTMTVDGETLDCLQVVLGGTSPGSGFPYSRVLERAFTVTAGQKFYARALGQMAAGANVESFELAFVNTGTETTASLAWFQPGEQVPGEEYTVMFQTEVITIPAGATSTSIRFRTYVPTGTAINATLKIADFWLVEVAETSADSEMFTADNPNIKADGI